MKKLATSHGGNLSQEALLKPSRKALEHLTGSLTDTPSCLILDTIDSAISPTPLQETRHSRLYGLVLKVGGRDLDLVAKRQNQIDSHEEKASTCLT